jgi:carboxypeptidase C (cathepsin A)
LYIVGESFGGHYAPVLANRLLSNSSWSSRVAGVIIGDGWTDPINQINYYDTYLWSLGIIDRSFRETVSWFQTQSMLNIDISNFQKVLFHLIKATDYFDFLTNNDTTA